MKGGATEEGTRGGEGSNMTKERLGVKQQEDLKKESTRKRGLGGGGGGGAGEGVRSGTVKGTRLLL